VFGSYLKDDILEIQSPLDLILLSLNKNANREQKFLLSGKKDILTVALFSI
jgi:hypothetical protein